MSETMKQYDAAMELHEMGNTDEAITQLESLLSQSPNFMLAHNSLAVFYERNGDADKALDHAKRVCELDPEDAFSYTGLSIAAIAAGQSSIAEDAKGKAEEIQWAEIRRRFEEEAESRKIAEDAANKSDTKNNES